MLQKNKNILKAAMVKLYITIAAYGLKRILSNHPLPRDNFGITCYRSNA